MYDAAQYQSDLDRAWQELKPFVGKGIKAPFLAAVAATSAITKAEMPALAPTKGKKKPAPSSWKAVFKELGNYMMFMIHAVWYLLQFVFFGIRFLLKK